MSLIRLLDYKDPTFAAEVQAMRQLLRGGGLTARSERETLDVPAIVRGIIDAVAERGDQAVMDLTQRFDHVALTEDSLRVPEQEIRQAHAECDPEFLALMRKVIANIREYQEHILVRAPEPIVKDGRVLGVRYTPIERVGIYVPGGRAIYPSTVLMTAVPAQVAKVRDIVMVSPPTGGDINPMVLAIAAELGIREVYRVGGAVAVAALALGTKSIEAVDKIVGPGNAFVAEAKRQLFGRVGIDSVAGPSEVFIVADDSARAEWVAADLMAQAEHDPGTAILATPSRALAEGVLQALKVQSAQLARKDAILAALSRYSAILVTESLDAACDIANQFATEHLQIQTREDARCLERIRHAGAIFIGPHTPVPVGDYFAGPSHVLPTGGTARFFSPLSANDFVKSSSLMRYDAAALSQDAAAIMDFAGREGLTAHAAAVGLRQNRH
jgi:histidinol dehydrogenase